MSISAQEVKELRDRSGVGMMDCKKALIEANGDLDKAFEILRKKSVLVTGIDLSQNMLDIAKKKTHRKNQDNI